VLPISGEKGQCVVDTHFFAGAHMEKAHSLLILSRANAHESDPVAVTGIHVRLNLENKSR
jgi:hypothetical protein